MRALPHPHLPAFFSEGGAPRAKALQGYLLSLREVYVRYAPLPPVHLFVLSEKDWRARLPYPYGLPFQHAGPEGLSVYAPLAYPERLLHRLREVLLPLGPPPGEIPAFLDLNLGHEYAHALQVAWRLRTGARWLDEFFANYLFLLGLAPQKDLLETLLAWSRYLSGLKPQKRSLSAYEGRRGGLESALWFQAHFTRKAEELRQKDQDRLLKAFLAAAPLDRKKGHRLLLELYPELKSWFAAFGLRGAPGEGSSPRQGP
ncbi:hypothetical protein SAMN04488243_10416 [Thermus arciformis]|uniref:Uncharacterized protein n=1 Tax=Thermus arciformis TaxID=482827 RepID=A0A1G7DYI4_9DEIN|nr:hypothetical protein [Thermus arciformis]SDE56518.1 hypothetical protein SAMN04488243_10416 [Thermus arciformis]